MRRGDVLAIIAIAVAVGIAGVLLLLVGFDLM